MKNSKKSLIQKHGWRNILIFLLSCCILGVGLLLVWVSTFQIPSLDTIDAIKDNQSTKIYDSTGTILLYDVYQDTKRTVVQIEQISPYIQEATISIEDKNFYTNDGIEWSSIIRAFLVDLTTLNFTQGASTITQQVVKNSILTGDKTPERKLKEVVLSLKLDKVLTKDQILSMYLNDISYGGNTYGVEEASENYFGTTSAQVTLAEAAYLAALPQAPSYYSPYGANRAALDDRKNLVLKEMLTDGKITQDQYTEAVNEKVNFLPVSDNSIKAPHFVMFVINYLQQKYGADVLEDGGLKVITTLNYTLQAEAEQIAKQYALSNEKQFNGSNDAFVAIDPKTGGILTMVGSRDYFDTEIDGQFNVATAHRQPGSTFKPFVYAEAFIKGYTPDTVLFDLPVQFSVDCPINNFTTTPDNKCYSPVNYDNQFRGPMTLRDALAQSINVPSVEVLYLAGIQDSITLAENMGIQSLGDPNQYGLTLVLGGGEVSLLDMTSAYGVFATEGVRNPYTAIQEVQDKDGNVLEQLTPHPTQVLDPQVARQISDILNDNVARTPLYGANSVIYFPGRDVAVKTGTTNDYKDAWTIGYTPSVVVGTWAGNNDNTPMDHQVSGLIVAPMWRAFMDDVLKTVPVETFTKPAVDDSYNLKPVLRGEWQGGISTLTANPNPNPNIPYNNVTETLSGGVHSILYWLNKDDPRGPAPTDPTVDPQEPRWEYSIRIWAAEHGYQ